jgi:uncharacterized coiled-coil protein SlyX
MSMCLWVRAMDTYATVYRIVEPKRKILAEAQAALDASNAILAQKQQQLKELKDKVVALQQQLTDTQKQLAALQFQVRCRLLCMRCEPSQASTDAECLMVGWQLCAVCHSTGVWQTSARRSYL